LPSSGPRPKAGETILIEGGAGGVAGFGVQLAKHLGATVIATASASNHYSVRSLGADRVDFAAQKARNPGLRDSKGFPVGFTKSAGRVFESDKNATLSVKMHTCARSLATVSRSSKFYGHQTRTNRRG
jgi:NADPH:quinone reductase-like Zn-dependent oxidoreductase